MDQIKELEKYKELLDEGVISEDEFRKLKQKLLGLKSDEEKEIERQQEREEALAEVEKMRTEEAAKQAGVEREIQRQTQAKEEQTSYEKIYAEEKAKEQARLEAIYEQEQKIKQERLEEAQRSLKIVTRLVGKVVCWILTVFCALIGSLSFIPSGNTNGAFNTVSAIFFLVFAAFACPPLSAKMKENEKLAANWKYKKYIVIAFVILWFVFAAILS